MFRKKTLIPHAALLWRAGSITNTDPARGPCESLARQPSCRRATPRGQRHAKQRTWLGSSAEPRPATPHHPTSTGRLCTALAESPTVATVVRRASKDSLSRTEDCLMFPTCLPLLPAALPTTLPACISTGPAHFAPGPTYTANCSSEIYGGSLGWVHTP